ncbi:MAG: hypothetical protein ACRYGG_13945 [Janthinobacterium lividum]
MIPSNIPHAELRILAARLAPDTWADVLVTAEGSHVTVDSFGNDQTIPLLAAALLRALAQEGIDRLRMEARMPVEWHGLLGIGGWT